MAYSTINKGADYFTPLTLTSNPGSDMIVTGVGFQPDFVWLKARDEAYAWKQYDSVRGVEKRIRSDSDTGEATISTGLLSYDSDGFTLGTDTDINDTNTDPMSWSWKAGTTSGLSGGTITPTGYSFNTTAGISIIAYTGTGSVGTIPHGLGATPKLILVKRLDTTANWRVYHAANTSEPATEYLILNLASATADNVDIWNDTQPTDEVFTVGTSTTTNASGGTFVAYCFSEISGYSKFGSYIGNNSANGTFVYTGFKPSLVIQKQTSSAGEYWMMKDNKRNLFNPTNLNLYPNATNTEVDTNGIDLLSNGFKMRTSGAGSNHSGETYIYIAFGQPLISNSGVCATAR